MSNAPQNPKAQNNENSNQSKPTQVGNNIKKDEPTAQTGKDRMKNEGGSSSSVDKKSA